MTLRLAIMFCLRLRASAVSAQCESPNAVRSTPSAPDQRTDPATALEPRHPRTKSSTRSAGVAVGFGRRKAARTIAAPGPAPVTRASERSAGRRTGSQRQISQQALSQVEILNQQIAALRRQIGALEDALNVSETRDRDSNTKIADLGRRLNVALAQRVQELNRYRSDFFGRLREILADRENIRIVGDRFVFQSEVLFPTGSK